MSAELRLEQVESSTTAPQVIYGTRSRVVVLPGKWQTMAVATLINADYTVIACTTRDHYTGIVVQPDAAADSTTAIRYTPDDISGFLERVAQAAQCFNRFAHIVGVGR